MKIAHLNIRSLFTGFQEFKEIVLENDIDIMLLSETWLGPDDHSVVVDIPGYTLFRKDRVGRGGGVGAYVKVSIVPYCSAVHRSVAQLGDEISKSNLPIFDLETNVIFNC
ncbi:hypothetical protein JTB14_016820 [Gonioctena quinquepunctata]|nr:hypothetical protein JTB14_016820 [Gonioctena quinquepunctata]